MNYCTYCIQSDGQPASPAEVHTDLRAATAAWLANMAGLVVRAGGRSVLIDHSDGSRLVWTEHAEGGFVSAGGAWEDDIVTAARLAHEDGEVLTAAQAADAINR